jgi:hypothetical protein
MPESRNATHDKQTRRRSVRRFRLWGKKRGSRHTGSKRWGSTGEALFFAILFLTGVLLLTELVVLRVMWNSQSFFASGWGLWLSVLLLSSLVVIGAAGAVHSAIVTGTSAERRAAFAKRASDIELLAESQATRKNYPCIPRDTNWKNSPGIRLAYRLPIAGSPAWRLGVVAVSCLIWNGIVAVLVVLALNQPKALLERERDIVAVEGSTTLAPEKDSAAGRRYLMRSPWAFRLMVLGYAAMGGAILFYLFHLLVAAAAIGPTSIEVSAQPFFPGKKYDVFIAQSGHLNVNWLEMRLVCDEEVSFSEGTDTRSESRRVIDELILRKEGFLVLPSCPFQLECALDVPSHAMHSFLSAHNAVIWKVIVRVEAKKWPIFEREFPLVVYPASPTTT